MNRITKKHSFRSVVNRDSNPQEIAKTRDKASPKILNSSSLKFALQEYAPSPEAEKQSAMKVKQRVQVRRDVVTGEVTASAVKHEITPASNTLQNYYDLLITQKKPFNLRKGNLVTADRI